MNKNNKHSSVVVNRSKQAIAITVFCLGVLLLSTFFLNFAPLTLAVLSLDFTILSILLFIINDKNLEKKRLFIGNYRRS